MTQEKIDINKFVPHDVFFDFRAGLDDVIIIQKINEKLYENLRIAGIIFNGSESLKIADIACGYAEPVIKYLEKIDFSNGFIYRGIDLEEKYSGENGIAYKNLFAAKESGKVLFKDIFVRQADFNSHAKLNNFLFKNNETVEGNTFNIAYFLHAGYFVKSDENLNKILYELAYEILRVDGVVILDHNSAEDGSAGYFMLKYIDKDKRAFADPASSIASSCKKQNIPCYTLEYSGRLHFSSNFKEYAEIFKNPSRYNELLGLHEDLKDYNKLSFLTCRGDEVLEDKSDKGLEAFVDEVINTVVKFENKWYLPVFSKLQMILNPKSTEEWRSRIEDVIKKTEIQIPEAMIQGEEEYKNKLL